MSSWKSRRRMEKLKRISTSLSKHSVIVESAVCVRDKKNLKRREKADGL